MAAKKPPADDPHGAVSPRGLLAVLLTEQADLDKRLTKTARKVFPRGSCVSVRDPGGKDTLGYVDSVCGPEARVEMAGGGALYVSVGHLLASNPEPG